MSNCGTLTADCIVRLPLEDDSVVEDAATAPVSNLGPASALLLWIEEETCAKERSIAHALPTRWCGSKISRKAIVGGLQI